MSSSPPSRTRIALIELLALIAVIAGVAIRTAAPALGATSPTCKATYSGNVNKPVMRAAALKVLVPHGADSLLVCRYGLGTRGFTLTDAGLADTTDVVSRITDGLDAITASKHLICPDDELLGGETLTFSYRSGPDVLLTVNLGGCLQISNGHITRPGLDAPVLAELEALLRPVKAAAA
jgi:hypothetical protein